MQTVKIVCGKDGKFWLGYLQDHPDYWTPGISRLFRSMR
jgi:hypothetical protein